MIRKCLSFILHSRLENVMAVAVSGSLLILFLTTRLFYSFGFGPLDFVFIMLPIGVLGVKSFLGLLLAPENEAEENPDPLKFLAGCFQPLLKIVRDWFPFLLLSACYYSMGCNLVLRINPHTADATLAKVDAFILGNQASFMLEPWIHPWLTDFLNVVYFSHLIFFPGVALYFYLVKDENAFRRLMMGYLTIMLLGITTYMLIPATGPEKFFADRYTRDLQGQTISRGVAYIISVGRVSYDCFPSLHVGIPLLLSLYLRVYRRKLFVPSLIYVALMCCATIYLRYHYLIDVVGAFIYAPAAYFLNDFLLAHWPGERISGLSAEIKKGKASLQNRQI
ncbi:MAG: phosphatase PAP2 family protein [Verrucomicrobiia bacterium]|jgi:membrane-associated phospholipid phosphatase